MENSYEVEQKFRIEDLAQLETQLRSLGATPFVACEQVDTYFAHPARDFGETDEAFRLRRVGAKNFVTYKGPKIDTTTKTRREIELPLPDGVAYTVQFRLLIESLGFQAVADVSKVRRKTHVSWDDAEIEISLDDVAQVGCYAELELVVSESRVTQAKARIASLASRLGLLLSERRSYLELLLRE
ncbi:MAG: class IV adenylate cyclase [Planctomycetaceae bacterium]|nr:class IV adenylate cyclase [Planctomycetales bacterium]MCB9938919.1 class IV adenylate cyclase [Planctomycetaceae bacterium]